MVRKICLDSDIIIELLKNNQDVINKIISLNATFYTTPINLFEVWYGKSKQEGTEEFIHNIEVIDISKDIGLLAAENMEKLRKNGLLIDFRDMFIASACISKDIELLTNNKKHFERMKSLGLKLV